MSNDLHAFVRDLDRVIEGVTRAGNRAALETALAVEAEAIRRSSGNATLAEMRVADHPFAKRHGQALWDRSTINVQSGEFRAHWLIEPNPQPGGLILYVVRNDSRVAEFLEHGTRTMFSRPLREALTRYAQATWDRVAPPLIEDALRVAFDR